MHVITLIRQTVLDHCQNTGEEDHQTGDYQALLATAVSLLNSQNRKRWAKSANNMGFVISAENQASLVIDHDLLYPITADVMDSMDSYEEGLDIFDRALREAWDLMDNTEKDQFLLHETVVETLENNMNIEELYKHLSTAKKGQPT